MVNLSKLTEQSVHHIIDLMQYEKVENGTSICMQGEAADSMYLLMKGKVKIKIDDKVVATLGKGKIFGDGDQSMCMCNKDMCHRRSLLW